MCHIMYMYLHRELEISTRDFGDQTPGRTMSQSTLKEILKPRGQNDGTIFSYLNIEYIK
jgi:hypothetical protein